MIDPLFTLHPHDRFPLTGETKADMGDARAVLAAVADHTDEQIIDACAVLRHSPDEDEADEAIAWIERITR